MWTEDHRLSDAARIDTLTVGVFTWALTQTTPEAYDFTVLDRIVARAAAGSAWPPAPVPTRRGWPRPTPRSPAPTSRAAGTYRADFSTLAF